MTAPTETRFPVASLPTRQDIVRLLTTTTRTGPGALDLITPLESMFSDDISDAIWRPIEALYDDEEMRKSERETLSRIVGEETDDLRDRFTADLEAGIIRAVERFAAEFPDAPRAREWGPAFPGAPRPPEEVPA